MQSIEEAIADNYLMFFNPGVPVSSLRSLQTIKNSIDVVNDMLANYGLNLSTWNYGMRDEIGRLMNVNWMYQRLATEPIRKPILVHSEIDYLTILCGDTRAMVLGLLENPPLVSVMATCTPDQSYKYRGWQPVFTSRDLVECVRFEPASTRILYNKTAPGSGYAFDWFEIGDISTSHHLHDLDCRVDMMQRYLDQQPESFKFTPAWARSAVDWK